MISPDKATAPVLGQAIQEVLTNPIYRQNAQRMQVAIKKTCGAEAAVRIIEQAIQTRKPVKAVLRPLPHNPYTFACLTRTLMTSKFYGEAALVGSWNCKTISKFDMLVSR